MTIIIKNTHKITLANVLIFGLSACSNTPAPWTQVDDSPWGNKHEAQSQSIPADTIADDTSLNDPVLLADTELTMETEAITMQAPDAASSPEVIAPVVVEDEPAAEMEQMPAVVVAEETQRTGEQDIMAMLSSNYAVQVYASKTVESIEKFKTSKGLDDLFIVKTDRSGKIIYVLVDVYPDRTAANAAATELEIKTGSKPWVRSLAGLQEIVAK
jgi:septal ring-binding cell division protein DamX